MWVPEKGAQACTCQPSLLTLKGPSSAVALSPIMVGSLVTRSVLLLSILSHLCRGGGRWQPLKSVVPCRAAGLPSALPHGTQVRSGPLSQPQRGVMGASSPSLLALHLSGACICRAGFLACRTGGSGGGPEG